MRDPFPLAYVGVCVERHPRSLFGRSNGPYEHMATKRRMASGVSTAERTDEQINEKGDGDFRREALSS